MKTKTIFIIFILILINSIYSFADDEEIIFYETFEEYTINGNGEQVTEEERIIFFEESYIHNYPYYFTCNPNIKNPSDYIDDCYSEYDSTTPSDIRRNISINSEYGNKYLSLQSDYFALTDINAVNFYLGFYNDTITLNDDGIFYYSYDMRVDYTTYGFYSGYNINHYAYSSTSIRPIAYPSSNYYIGSSIGGNIDIGSVYNSTSYNNWTSIKIFNKYSTNPRFYPQTDNSLCYVGDGDWHNIFTEVVTENGNLTEINTYVDYVLCDSQSINTAISKTITSIYFRTMGGFDVSYDNILIGTGYYTFPSDFDGSFTCPYDNCIYYDGFDYYENFSLTVSGYSGNTENFYSNGDSLLYPNDEGLITHVLPDYEYDKIENNIIFEIFSNYTDIDLKTDTLYYSFADVCTNGNTVSDIYVLFDYYENESSLYTGYETAVNFYRKTSSGSLLSIGSFVIFNGQNFGFTRIYDTLLKKYYINFYTTSNYETGFIPVSKEYVYNYNSPCDNIDSFRISRGGNSDTINFYGIEEISYIGDFLTSDTGLDFIYTEEILQNESLVSSDIGEELQNLAFTFGFKTTQSKLFFWLIMMGLAIFLLINANIDNTIKLITSSFVIIGGFVVGFFLGFIPVIVFSFFLLITSIIIGITIIKIFKGSADG